MSYVIIDADTGEYAHGYLYKYIPINEKVTIPFKFHTKEEAMEVLNKVTFPEWQFLEIVEA